MNQVPQSADLSKLKGILSNAKAVMNKVNENSSNGKSLPSNNATTTNTTNYISEEQFNNANAVQQQPQRKITKESIRNSKLPDAIKKAMLENPIQQSNSLIHSFNLEDVADLIEPQKQVKENIVHNNDNISEAKIREIVKDVLLEYLTEDYNKKLTENAIKKTINTLLKEGKIKTKK